MTIQVVSISNHTRQRLRSLAEGMPSPYINICDSLAYAKNTQEILPNELKENIAPLLTDCTSQPAVVIRNLEVDNSLQAMSAEIQYPVTKHTFYSEYSLLAAGTLLGSIFSYSAEKDGNLIHNISPSLINKSSISNSGSDCELQMHTEIAHLFPHCPDFVLLFCLRKDRLGQAVTYLIRNMDILEQLNSVYIDVMRKCIFEVSSPESFIYPSIKKSLRPLLFGNQLILQLNTTSTIDNEGAVVLRKIRKLCDTAMGSHIEGLVLNPGDLLIMSNLSVQHARSRFPPPRNAFDRWLQRTYVKCNVDDLKTRSTNRPFVYDF